MAGQCRTFINCNNPVSSGIQIEKQNPKVKNQILLEVYDERNVINDTKYVMDKWKREFSVILCCRI